MPVPQTGSAAQRLPAKQPAASPTISAKDLRKWERVQSKLQAKLGADVYSSWFGRCKLEQVSKSQIVHSVPTNFLRTWIRSHYAAQLLQFWQEELKDVLRIDLMVRSAARNTAATRQEMTEEDADTEAAGQAANPSNGGQSNSIYARNGMPLTRPGAAGLARPGSALSGTPFDDNHSSGNRHGWTGDKSRANNPDAGPGFSGSPLDRNFTFATLVEGEPNQMAAAAARSVAESDSGALRFNPLFIHASVGLGKTHLLQAIAWATIQRNNGTRILYLTAEYFMWRFASAIRDQAALTFKENLRDIDLLLIDDMQFLQGKSIQAEFCHLINALIDSAKQVVVAADRPPAELESLDARVRSRLQGGVALEVKAPDFEMRRAMLDLLHGEAQMDEPYLNIAPDVLDHVARTVKSSGRDVEGAFNQILMQHRFTDGPVTLDKIETILSHLVNAGEQKRVRIEDIQRIASRHYNVSRNDLLSNRRTQVIVRPRQIAMYLSKMLTPRSLPEIGRRFGGRDHTTVLHAVRKIEKLIAEDPKLAQEIELLKRLIME